MTYKKVKMGVSILVKNKIQAHDFVLLHLKNVLTAN